MTLKEMLNRVLSESGFLQRTRFSASTDPDNIQMVAIANRATTEIMDFFDWHGIRQYHSIAVQAGQLTYTLPSDFSSLVPDSIWEQNGTKPAELPVSDRRWYMYKSSAIGSSGSLKLRLVGNTIEFADAEEGDVIEFEYISKWLVRGSSGSAKEMFTADDDTFILNDNMLIAGIKAFWKETKVMPNAEKEMAVFYRIMNKEVAKTVGGKTIGGRKVTASRSPYTPLYVK
jgi:hypothetical protein